MAEQGQGQGQESMQGPMGARASMNPGDLVPEGTPYSGENLCRACGGAGKQNGQDCPQCGGTGKVIEPVSEGE